jgi:hypothetical protein
MKIILILNTLSILFLAATIFLIQKALNHYDRCLELMLDSIETLFSILQFKKNKGPDDFQRSHNPNLN